MVTTLFIGGTDTGVGKTRVVAALAVYFQQFYPQQRVALFKPLQSGVGDREYYRQQFALTQTLEEVNPLYFEAPLAPPLAAALEGKSIDLGLAWQMFQRLQHRYDIVLVEGVGGLGSPITPELTVADLAFDWKLPTVLVVPVRLGAIGQAIGQVALAQNCRVPLRGLILSCPEPCEPDQIEHWASPALLQSFTHLPVLGILPYQESHLSPTLPQTVSQWNLEGCFPVLKHS